jgi:hypothetical protein
MKKLLVILLFPLTSFSQIADTCFTEQQVLDISFTLDSLTELNDINEQIISEQKHLLEKQGKLIELDSMQIAYREQQLVLLQKNIDLYVEREKRLQPKWYDHKALWFSGGILTTLFTGVIITEYFK